MSNRKEEYNHFDITDWRDNRWLRNERLRVAALDIIHNRATYANVRTSLRAECDYMTLDKNGQALFRQYDMFLRDVLAGWPVATPTEKALFTARLMPISSLASRLKERLPIKARTKGILTT